jgi:hypothetical protein
MVNHRAADLPQAQGVAARRFSPGAAFLLKWPSKEGCMSDTGSKGASGPGAEAERRGGPRIPIEMWVEETTDSERYFRRAGNLSRGGLRLDHTIPLPLGTVVNLTFTLPGDETPITIAGEIVSNAGPEDLRMGVKFVSPSKGAQAQIDAYLARVGASP